ncbi:hypothetical protein D8771_10085 [Streptomyces albus]|uniref:Uncharacterized protein n=1 Tax=Streptomyces albus TaxID=1888 RepID=A0A8H1LFV2_9ACTN|nr:hypothetical protein D8771_10085 [Streptomyces albus]
MLAASGEFAEPGVSVVPTAQFAGFFVVLVGVGGAGVAFAALVGCAASAMFAVSAESMEFGVFAECGGAFEGSGAFGGGKGFAAFPELSAFGVSVDRSEPVASPGRWGPTVATGPVVSSGSVVERAVGRAGDGWRTRRLILRSASATGRPVNWEVRSLTCRRTRALVSSRAVG